MTNLATSYKPASAVSDSFNIGLIFSLTSAEIQPSPAIYGFNNGGGGAISPGTLLGQTIQLFLSGPGVVTTLYVDSPLAQNAFTSVTIGGTTLLSADATYDGTPPFAIWQWNATLITGTGPFTVTFA